MKNLHLICALVFVIAPSDAIAQKVDSVQVHEMKKVQWLAGKWKGEGWIMMGPGQ